MHRYRVPLRALCLCIALLCVPVFMVAALNTIGCCAIDPDKYPAKVAANKRRQNAAALVALGSVVAGFGALGGVILLRPPRRRAGELPATSANAESPARPWIRHS